MCPSNAVNAADTIGYGLTDYMPIAYVDLAPTGGTATQPIAGLRDPSTSAGMGSARDSAFGLFCNKMADVTDGTSNTAAFGEQLLGDGVNSAPAGNDFRRRVVELPMATQTTEAACTATGAPAWSGQRGAKWINGHMADAMYNHYFVPNAKVPDCHNGFHNFAITSARSTHAGGVQVAIVDGSVRFVSENLDQTIWRGIATRDGGEVPGEF